ncbi:nnp-1 protein putative nuclear protein 1 nop52 [Anaeramoeba flamelloides]|uniref:Nnp-1 protein putative nuclear protein 1 nop52 n=1 Tax=Anaeramoeba flamelloides TaxID=1746091 RepID=A0AAV7YTB8_9EUKA|nr:nnp-1 protein putative nuclear protein 1 nop52 [Anaeramoeba flamelloides]
MTEDIDSLLSDLLNTTIEATNQLNFEKGLIRKEEEEEENEEKQEKEFLQKSKPIKFEKDLDQLLAEINNDFFPDYSSSSGSSNHKKHTESHKRNHSVRSFLPNLETLTEDLSNSKKQLFAEERTKPNEQNTKRTTQTKKEEKSDKRMDQLSKLSNSGVTKNIIVKRKRLNSTSHSIDSKTSTDNFKFPLLDISNRTRSNSFGVSKLSKNVDKLINKAKLLSLGISAESVLNEISVEKNSLQSRNNETKGLRNNEETNETQRTKEEQEIYLDLKMQGGKISTDLNQINDEETMGKGSNIKKNNHWHKEEKTKNLLQNSKKPKINLLAEEQLIEDLLQQAQFALDNRVIQNKQTNSCKIKTNYLQKQQQQQQQINIKPKQNSKTIHNSKLKRNNNNINKIKKKKESKLLMLKKKYSKLIKKRKRKEKKSQIMQESNIQKKKQLKYSQLKLIIEKNFQLEELQQLNIIIRTTFQLLNETELLTDKICHYFSNSKESKIDFSDKIKKHLKDIIELSFPKDYSLINEIILNKFKNNIKSNFKLINNFKNYHQKLDKILNQIKSDIIWVDTFSILKTKDKLINHLFLEFSSYDNNNTINSNNNNDHEKRQKQITFAIKKISDELDLILFTVLFFKYFSNSIFKLFYEKNLFKWNSMNIKSKKKKRKKIILNDSIFQFYSTIFQQLFFKIFIPNIKKIPNFKNIENNFIQILNQLFINESELTIKKIIFESNQKSKSYLLHYKLEKFLGKERLQKINKHLIELKKNPNNFFNQLIKQRKQEQLNNTRDNKNNKYENNNNNNNNNNNFILEKDIILIIGILDYFLKTKINNQEKLFFKENFSQKFFNFLQNFNLLKVIIKYLIYYRIEYFLQNISNLNISINKNKNKENWDDKNENGDDLTSNFFVQYCYYYGKNYLKTTIGPIIKEISKKNINFDTNADNLPNFKTLNANIQNICFYLSKFLSQIFNLNTKNNTNTNMKVNTDFDTDEHYSLDLPNEILFIFNEIKAFLEIKSPDHISIIIGKFIFNYFFCPAIEDPYKYKIIDYQINKQVKSNLLFFSNICKTFAKGTTIVQDQYTKPINKIIIENFSNRTHYLKTISNFSLKGNQLFINNSFTTTNKHITTTNNNDDQKILLNKINKNFYTFLKMNERQLNSIPKIKLLKKSYHQLTKRKAQITDLLNNFKSLSMEIKQTFPNLLPNAHDVEDDNDNNNTNNIKKNNSKKEQSKKKIWSKIWNTETIKEGYGFIPKEKSQNPLIWGKRFFVLKKNSFVVYQNKPPSHAVDPSSFFLIDDNLLIELKLELKTNPNSKTKKFPILVMDKLNSRTLIVAFANSRQQKNWYNSMINLKKK